MKDLVRAKIVPQLRSRLVQMGPQLIAEHGKDLQHATGHAPSLQANKVTSSSSVTSSARKAASPSVPIAAASSGSSSGVNTVEITSTDEFRTTAQELYNTFTLSDRLTAFTRAPPTVFEGAHEGARFSLFGGNVSGSFEMLEPPTKLVQKWRLGSWPANHYSTLQISFDQNDRDAVTVMRVAWHGVPVGEEEVVKRNWGEFYVRSIKTTFG